jgi:hypothetical protein
MDEHGMAKGRLPIKGCHPIKIFKSYSGINELASQRKCRARFDWGKAWKITSQWAYTVTVQMSKTP